MADAGITDMQLTFNVVGQHKLDRLAELPDRLPTEKFRAWLERAPEKLFQAIEQATSTSR